MTSNNPKAPAAFNAYVLAWVAAALALPTALTWTAIPAYDAQKAFLTTYSTLACILILAFLFYIRDVLIGLRHHRMRTISYGFKCLPLLLIGGSLVFGFLYVGDLQVAAYYNKIDDLSKALKDVPLNAIRNSSTLMAYYILTLVCAEAALFIMFMRE